MTPTLTVIVPAHNEQEGLPATLEALLRQTAPAEEIIVVDDGSTDRTGEIAALYGVTVLRPPANLGSKAKAQNYALAHCRTDLVLPVDADTVLADDYIQRVKPAFDDQLVAVAAGAVGTRFQKTVWERGREIEYLFGFNWFRPVQNGLNSPTVCSGCCTVFDLAWLLGALGGFPERTMVEDIDATWTAQIAGRRAVYVAGAMAYAAEPTSAKYLAVQLNRWKHGWFQNIRLHYRSLWRRKPLLALWVTLSLLEIVVSPLTLAAPVLWLTVFHGTVASAARWWLVGEAALMGPPLTYATIRGRANPLRILWFYPSYYVLKAFNAWFDWKALVVELILVPAGLAKGLRHYEKGRADTAGAVQHVPARRRVAISPAGRYFAAATLVAAAGAFFAAFTIPQLAASHPGGLPVVRPPAAAAPAEPGPSAARTPRRVEPVVVARVRPPAEQPARARPAATPHAVASPAASRAVRSRPAPSGAPSTTPTEEPTTDQPPETPTPEPVTENEEG